MMRKATELGFRRGSQSEKEFLLRGSVIQTAWEWAKSSSSFLISVSVSRLAPGSVMISYVSAFRSVLVLVTPSCVWAFRWAPALVKPSYVWEMNSAKALGFLSAPYAFAFAPELAWAKRRTFGFFRLTTLRRGLSARPRRRKPTAAKPELPSSNPTRNQS